VEVMASQPQTVEVEEFQGRNNGMDLCRKSEKGTMGGCGFE
jgi:hypothetical protein